MTTGDVEVVHAAEESRYEIRRGGELVGLTTYSDSDGTRTFLHTEVDPDHEGQGLGSELVRHALDHSREQQLEVVPRCAFVASFIARHPEYGDLVAAAD